MFLVEKNITCCINVRNNNNVRNDFLTLKIGNSNISTISKAIFLLYPNQPTPEPAQMIPDPNQTKFHPNLT